MSVVKAAEACATHRQHCCEDRSLRRDSLRWAGRLRDYPKTVSGPGP